MSDLVPGVLELLAMLRKWFEDLQPWVDWNYTQVDLFEGVTNTGEEWAKLASTTMIWIVIPLAIALFTLRRTEVK